MESVFEIYFTEKTSTPAFDKHNDRWENWKCQLNTKFLE